MSNKIPKSKSIDYQAFFQKLKEQNKQNKILTCKWTSPFCLLRSPSAETFLPFKSILLFSTVNTDPS